MKKKIRWGIILGCLLMCFAGSHAYAAWPVVSEEAPMSGSGWKNQEYTVYTSSNLAVVSEKITYRNCSIIKISGNAVYISYKVSGQQKTGWLPLDTFIYDNSYQHEISYANTDLTLYRRPSTKAATVKVNKHSGGLTVGERGSWKQVLFKKGKKHQLGWIKKSTHTALVRLSADTSTQALRNGNYTLSPQNNLKAALTYNSSQKSFTLTTNKRRTEQYFELRHYRGNRYSITPRGQTGSLVRTGSKLALSASEGNYWSVRRTGRYFYITDSTAQYCLTYSAGKLKVQTWKKTKAQRWQLTKMNITRTVENSAVFSQFDPRWGGSTYYQGAIKRTISTSGCGVVALTNALYALNGQFVNPKTIAKFSATRGHYYYMQGTSDTLYRDFANKRGKKYQFKHSGKVYTISKLRKHLEKGGTAIALVPGHYVAIVAYRASDKKYLVLDSAVYAKRPTTIHGDWVSAATLRSSHMKCEYFHLFSRR